LADALVDSVVPLALSQNNLGVVIVEEREESDGQGHQKDLFYPRRA
jgi:hypothetical protein